MENTNVLRAAIAGSDIPATWLYCFTSSCTLRDTCIRYQAGLVLDASRTCGNAVFPTAAGDNCPHFKLLRMIRTAWGLARLFDEVCVGDAPTLRKRLKTMLGGNGSYYRFHHGTRRLTPEQQAEVRQLFARFGYGNVDFEHYRDEIEI